MSLNDLYNDMYENEEIEKMSEEEIDIEEALEGLSEEELDEVADMIIDNEESEKTAAEFVAIGRFMAQGMMAESSAPDELEKESMMIDLAARIADARR